MLENHVSLSLRPSEEPDGTPLPEGCNCMSSVSGPSIGHDDYGALSYEHDPLNSGCALYWCPECEHPAHEGECPVERDDALVGEALQAMGPCTCGMTLECDGIARHMDLGYRLATGTEPEAA